MISCYACHVATEVLQTVLEPGDVAQMFSIKEKRKKKTLLATYYRCAILRVGGLL